MQAISEKQEFCADTEAKCRRVIAEFPALIANKREIQPLAGDRIP